VSEIEQFFQMSTDDRFEIYDAMIIKNESTDIDKHYIYHTAWAARILAETKPEIHTDISSSVSFNAIISAFIPTIFYDFRPPELSLDNLLTDFADLNELPCADNSIESLSCMHVVEHIGLGRYGDPIDPNGDLKAISELTRVVSRDLLFVVPIGKPKVLFNLHRIYSYEQIIEYFKELKLIEFSLIPDKGNLIRNAPPALADEQEYGCGCFWFRKD